MKFSLHMRLQRQSELIMFQIKSLSKRQRCYRPEQMYVLYIRQCDVYSSVMG